MIIVVAIISTILSYPSWIIMLLTGNLFGSSRPELGVAPDYISTVVICLAVLFFTRIFYRLYSRTGKRRIALWGQIGFIFLVSFIIKFIFDAIFILPGNILSYFIMYGMDIIIIAPIAVFVNLKIANHKRRKTTTEN